MDINIIQHKKNLTQKIIDKSEFLIIGYFIFVMLFSFIKNFDQFFLIYILLGLIALKIILSIFRKEYDIIGRISFERKLIEIFLNESNSEIQYFDLESIIFDYKGHKNKFTYFSRSFTFDSGDDNYLTLKAKDEMAKYNIFIKEETDFMFLDNYLDEKSKEFNFVYKMHSAGD